MVIYGGSNPATDGSWWVNWLARPHTVVTQGMNHD